MYNSIQHFMNFGLGEIEKRVKKFIQDREDLGDFVIGLQEELFELGRSIVQEVLEEMDDYLRESSSRRLKWEIVRKDPTELLTSFGTINYERTYYKPKTGGKRRYLVDELVGIKPHDRMSADVVINAIDEASESSYRKGGKKAAYLDEISKQAVMNKVHELEVIQPALKTENKREPKILYIEADEDHVAQQGKNAKVQGKDKRSNILMPKLVYVHEGIDFDKSTKKRRVLKNTRYFGGICNSEELWLEVSQYIEKVYNTEKVETIYISGDGATWIKQGLNWIPKSKFVLDDYHLDKYIKTATAHLDDEAVTHGLKDALWEADKDMLKKVFKRISELTETETKQKAVNNAKRYMLNNWAGIEVKVDNFEIVGCSAEGHVSHVFSSRLSSRPMGWSRVGADKMAQLQIYKKNGGKVYNLVMAQKKKEQRDVKHKRQDELIRELKTMGKKYENVWNSNITVIHKGQRTALYKGLRNIIGM